MKWIPSLAWPDHFFSVFGFGKKGGSGATPVAGPLGTLFGLDWPQLEVRMTLVNQPGDGFDLGGGYRKPI